MPAIARNGYIYGSAPSGTIDADNVAYDNTTSQLDSTNVQSAIDELKELVDEGGGGGVTYSLSAGEGDDANKIILTPSTGEPDKVVVPYATDAGTVDGFTVGTSVPSTAVFTDTTDAADLTYDNTISGMAATTVQAAIDELDLSKADSSDIVTYTISQDSTDGHIIGLVPSTGQGSTVTIPDNNTTYTLEVGTGDDANKLVFTPSTGSATSITVPYASDAGTVNGFTVGVSVPSTAVFTDTTYSNATTAVAGLMSTSDKEKVDALGTASTKDVPVTGNASTAQVVMGNDTRLSDSRPASDVYSWAKAETKPSYTATEVGAIPSTEKGANNGVAELDATGKVPSSQLPSYVDDVLEYASLSAFPSTGEAGKIYIAMDTNKTYRWSGTTYVEISASLALGETDSTAYRGDRGKIAYDHSQLTTGNPHQVTKSDVGLGNVTNNAQVKGLASGTTENNVVIFGTDGYTVKDSGLTLGTSVPSTAVFTDTTYSAASNSGISLNTSTNEFSNSGVRAVATGSTNGTISVNTDGTSAEVTVAGLGSAAFTASTSYLNTSDYTMATTQDIDNLFS